MIKRKIAPVLAPFALSLAMVLGASLGCPPPDEPDGKNTVLLFTADGSSLAKSLVAALLPDDLKGAGPVDVADIKELRVDIDEIVLHRAGGDDPEDTVEVSNREFDPTTLTVEVGTTVTWIWTEAGEHSVTNSAVPAAGRTEGELFDFTRFNTGDIGTVTFTSSTLVPYFSKVPEDIVANMTGLIEVVPVGMGDNGSAGQNRVSIDPGVNGLDVDLLELLDIAVILGVEDLEPGMYTKIELLVSNPRLILNEDMNTVIEDIMLTANGRLFISRSFVIPEEGDNIIGLDFGGIHLVEKGNGGFNLTPQLRADITVTEAEVSFVAEILELGPPLVVDPGGDAETIDVDAATADVILADMMMGDTGDLLVGQFVEIQGTLNPDLTVTADTITIQP